MGTEEASDGDEGFIFRAGSFNDLIAQDDSRLYCMYRQNQG